jgi:hypothetical protein
MQKLAIDGGIQNTFKFSRHGRVLFMFAIIKVPFNDNAPGAVNLKIDFRAITPAGTGMKYYFFKIDVSGIILRTDNQHRQDEQDYEKDMPSFPLSVGILFQHFLKVNQVAVISKKAEKGLLKCPQLPAFEHVNLFSTMSVKQVCYHG